MKDFKGRIPLHYAVGEGNNTEFASDVIHICGTDDPDVQGNTPLHEVR
jgi:hypothetical protein